MTAGEEGKPFADTTDVIGMSMAYQGITQLGSWMDGVVRKLASFDALEARLAAVAQDGEDRVALEQRVTALEATCSSLKQENALLRTNLTTGLAKTSSDIREIQTLMLHSEEQNEVLGDRVEVVEEELVGALEHLAELEHDLGRSKAADAPRKADRLAATISMLRSRSSSPVPKADPGSPRPAGADAASGVDSEALARLEAEIAQLKEADALKSQQMTRATEDQVAQIARLQREMERLQAGSGPSSPLAGLLDRRRARTSSMADIGGRSRVASVVSTDDGDAEPAEAGEDEDEDDNDNGAAADFDAYLGDFSGVRPFRTTPIDRAVGRLHERLNLVEWTAKQTADKFASAEPMLATLEADRRTMQDLHQQMNRIMKMHESNNPERMRELLREHNEKLDMLFTTKADSDAVEVALRGALGDKTSYVDSLIAKLEKGLGREAKASSSRAEILKTIQKLRVALGQKADKNQLAAIQQAIEAAGGAADPSLDAAARRRNRDFCLSCDRPLVFSLGLPRGSLPVGAPGTQPSQATNGALLEGDALSHSLPLSMTASGSIHNQVPRPASRGAKLAYQRSAYRTGAVESPRVANAAYNSPFSTQLPGDLPFLGKPDSLRSDAPARPRK